ncbi:MAG: DUF3109 family protein [Tannerella sp.]|nr:DUF3109 family protein [Tannerella sp.]
MLQIDETLVSLELIERCFCCDLAHCKGACCIEGDAGAPLTRDEFDLLRNILPVLWDDLSPQAQAVIRRQGIGYIDRDGEIVTSIVDGEDCVFTCYDADGTCCCTIEKACREKRIDFLKPLSCHLYPVRVTQHRTFQAVNYHHWKICHSAELCGAQKGLPVYRFLREPLIRKFGQDWYEELDLCAREYLQQNAPNKSR